MNKIVANKTKIIASMISAAIIGVGCYFSQTIIPQYVTLQALQIIWVSVTTGVLTFVVAYAGMSR